MVFDPESLAQKAAGEKKKHRKLFNQLGKMKTAELDALVHPLHEKYSEKIDCLSCANCCKSISPAVSDRDIERISRFLRKRPSELTEMYFNLDSDGDYVFREQPCPFLGDDNYCSIYEVRPRACREYPHTDRNKQQQILKLTMKNAALCPIVAEIVDELSEKLQK